MVKLGKSRERVALLLGAAVVAVLFVIPLSYVILIEPHSPVSRVLTPKRYKVASLEQKAFTRFFGGDYKGALPDLEKIVELDPKNEKARLCLGNIHARNGDVEKATAEFRSILERNPKSDEAYANLGAVSERKAMKAASENKKEDAARLYIEAENYYLDAIKYCKVKKKGKRGFLSDFNVLSSMKRKSGETAEPFNKRTYYDEALERVRMEKQKTR